MENCLMEHSPAAPIFSVDAHSYRVAIRAESLLLVGPVQSWTDWSRGWTDYGQFI